MIFICILSKTAAVKEPAERVRLSWTEKAVKSCVLTTRLAVGHDIITTEGLSEAEKEAFVYAFGAKGSVQCGFCIPGMVMAGKALIDRVPDPTEEQIRTALKGNICRCNRL